MNKKSQSPQISNAILFVSSFVVPLAVFFIFATLIDIDFFLYISLGLVVIILILLPLQFRLATKRAEVRLKIQDLDERMNMTDVEVRNEQMAIASFKNKIINYAHLKDLTERLSKCLYLEDTTKRLSADVTKLFKRKDATVILYLLHSKTGELGISVSQKGEMKVNIKSKKGDIFDQWVVKTMQPLLIEDAKSDYRFDIDKIVTEDSRIIRSLISSPLTIGNKALGILRVDSPVEKQFATEDLRFLSTLSDIGAIAVENAQLFERVEEMAIKDSLTNLYLRRYLLERIPEEISRQMRHKSQMSFMMIDLDEFKQYNDKFGHVAGDIVLRTVGLMLGEHFSEPGYMVCRYGGEEFCVLLPHCTKKKAMEMAEAIRKKISKQTITLRRQKTRITTSIGVATFPVDALNKEELVHKADLALYAAKEAGRNCVRSA